MGLIGKIIAAKATAKVVDKLKQRHRRNTLRADPGIHAERAMQSPTFPVDAGAAAAAPAHGLHGNPLVARATRIYHDNPKLVAGLGLALAGFLASRVLHRR